MVRIYGDDLDVLREQAEEIDEILVGIDGSIDEHIELQVDVPQLEVTGRPREAQQLRPEAG